MALITAMADSSSSWRLERPSIIPAELHRWKLTRGFEEEIRYNQKFIMFQFRQNHPLISDNWARSRKLETDIENEQISTCLMQMWWTSYKYSVQEALSLRMDNIPVGNCKALCPRWHCSATLENTLLKSKLSLQSAQKDFRQDKCWFKFTHKAEF